MRLYTDNQGNWTGTQADAKKAWGKDMALVEVPVSKEALMKWLNKCRVVSQAHAQIAAQTTSAEVVDTEPVQQKTHPQSCSTNPNGWEVHDAVLNCDRKHLGAALGAIITRIHDEMEEV